MEYAHGGSAQHWRILAHHLGDVGVIRNVRTNPGGKMAIARTPLDERQAVERPKAGDPAAFEFLYQAHKRRVYNLCLRITNNRAIAEELTQEAFLNVFRRISTFRGDAAFTTWLHRIAANCARPWGARTPSWQAVWTGWDWNMPSASFLPAIDSCWYFMT